MMAIRLAFNTFERTRNIGSVICLVNTTAKLESPQLIRARLSSPTTSTVTRKYGNIWGRNTKWTSYKINSTINSEIIILALNVKGSWVCHTLEWIWYQPQHWRAPHHPLQRRRRQLCHDNSPLRCRIRILTTTTMRTCRITTCQRIIRWKDQGRHPFRHRLRLRLISTRSFNIKRQ